MHLCLFFVFLFFVFVDLFVFLFVLGVHYCLSSFLCSQPFTKVSWIPSEMLFENLNNRLYNCNCQQPTKFSLWCWSWMFRLWYCLESQVMLFLLSPIFFFWGGWLQHRLYGMFHWFSLEQPVFYTNGECFPFNQNFQFSYQGISCPVWFCSWNF